MGEVHTMQHFLDGMDENKMKLTDTEKGLLDALRYFVGKIAENQLDGKIPSHEFVSALTGLVYTLLKEHLPREMLAFQKHAGRKKILDEDFLLICRKTSLYATLSEYRDEISESPRVNRRSGRSND